MDTLRRHNMLISEITHLKWRTVITVENYFWWPNPKISYIQSKDFSLLLTYQYICLPNPDFYLTSVYQTQRFFPTAHIPAHLSTQIFLPTAYIPTHLSTKPKYFSLLHTYLCIFLPNPSIPPPIKPNDFAFMHLSKDFSPLLTCLYTYQSNSSCILVHITPCISRSSFPSTSILFFLMGDSSLISSLSHDYYNQPKSVVYYILYLECKHTSLRPRED